MAINTAYTTNNASQRPDSPSAAAGRITFPSTSIVTTDQTLVEAGFTPRYIRWTNVTSRVQVEWFEGMVADTCLKTAANGTRTTETTNLGLTICDSAGTASTTGRYFKVAQNATLAAILASEVCNWQAQG